MKRENPLKRDEDRIGRIIQTLGKAGLDAVVCAAAENVLMLTGYWPVTGTSVAVATASGHVALLAPEDEQQLARQGWANDVVVFKPASLQEIRSTNSVVVPELQQLLARLGLSESRLGSEHSGSQRIASYVAQYVYADELRSAAPKARWGDASDILSKLRESLTSGEIERLRLSCRAAQSGFESARHAIYAGVTEAQASIELHRAIVSAVELDAHRMMVFTFCMSGPNAYDAYAAYQRTRNRRIARGDFVLLHGNSCLDGFWTDVTRTFTVGEPTEMQSKIFDAIFKARLAGLQKIRPGAKAADVDNAARKVMAAHGFEVQFKHPSGHGVGFAAIDHNAPPRIHPTSPDVLSEGMVFNIEPGVYIEGDCGVRQCDMVMVTSHGHRLLTDFLSSPRELCLAIG